MNGGDRSLLPMSPQVFSILSGLVTERSGLQFESARADGFAEKVAGRAAELGFESLLDYYYLLRYDRAGSGELDALVETLVVGETYLFRELPPLELMVAEFLVPAIRSGRRPRLWSAACATGEEPHTVAMFLASRGLLDEVDLVASDISASAVARARSGRWSRRALRRKVPAFANPWLEVDDLIVSAAARLTNAVDWRRINLLDEAAIAALGTFDVVLCRNVLIYFSDKTARRVVERVGAQLRIGGALFVGVSESLQRLGTPLACEERNGVFLYRRTA
jgi:chemotaxis protein methyltransferase CheR